MRNPINQQQLDEEITCIYRPITIESTFTPLPLSDLSDREFELLAYLLTKEEIKEKRHTNITDITIMKGVAERGRDCVLYNNGTVCGLIQCKKYNTNLTRPQVLKEIIKFLLFSILDNTILPEPANFQYILYVSSDFTEPAIALVHSYKEELQKAIDNGDIQKFLDQVIDEYVSFAPFKQSQPLTQLISLLNSIQISTSNLLDLSSRIHKFPHLLSQFFNVKSIVDLGSADAMIRTALEEYGLKYLTDDDLKLLQKRIGNVAQENRINFGIADFFGFNTHFFKYIQGDPLKEIMHSIANLKIAIDKYQMEFLSKKINELAFNQITFGLLAQKKIHQYSVQIAAPYLLDRLTINIASKSLPEELLKKLYPQSIKDKKTLISEISQKLLSSSKLVMNGDYSQLEGDASLVEYKIKLFEHLHQGFTDTKDIEKQLEKDIPVLLQVLDKIESQLKDFFPEGEKTIIIKDGSFLDNKDEIDLFTKSMQKIEA